MKPVLDAHRGFVWTYIKFTNKHGVEGSDWASRLRKLHRKYVDTEEAVPPPASIPVPPPIQVATDTNAPSTRHISQRTAVPAVPRPVAVPTVPRDVAGPSVPEPAPTAPPSSTRRSFSELDKETQTEEEEEEEAAVPVKVKAKPKGKQVGTKTGAGPGTEPATTATTSSRNVLAVPTGELHDPPCGTCHRRNLSCVQNVTGGGCCNCRRLKHRCDYSKARTKRSKTPVAVPEESEEEEEDRPASRPASRPAPRPVPRPVVRPAHRPAPRPAPGPVIRIRPVIRPVTSPVAPVPQGDMISESGRRLREASATVAEIVNARIAGHRVPPKAAVRCKCFHLTPQMVS